MFHTTFENHTTLETLTDFNITEFQMDANTKSHMVNLLQFGHGESSDNKHFFKKNHFQTLFRNLSLFKAYCSSLNL